MNSEDMINLFIRLQRSIEITGRRLLKKMYPSPMDNQHINQTTFDLESHNKARLAKKMRDEMFQRYFKGASY
jgi:hypothetical protein